MKRTPSQIQEAFEIQKAALRASAENFDSGATWEALRLATAVYVLVHDGGKNSVSILSHLNKKVGLKFLCSSSPISDQNLIASHNLVFIEMSSNKVRYLPILDSFQESWRWTAFSTWWENDPIFSSGSGKNLVSRKNLVFHLRDKEGGAHYDAKIAQAEYFEMSKKPHWVSSVGDGAEAPVLGLETATMRQIAFELLQTLEKAKF